MLSSQDTSLQVSTEYHFHVKTVLHLRCMVFFSELCIFYDYILNIFKCQIKKIVCSLLCLFLPFGWKNL